MSLRYGAGRVKTAFTARNSLEAHIIRNLLEANGLEAFVMGSHLEGGAGELQAGGVVTVAVEDAHWDEARELVRLYESGELDAGDGNAFGD